MHGLQACLFQYISVAAFRIYAQRGEDAAKREVGCHALKSHGNYIVDHGKSWKDHGIEFFFLNFCGKPEFICECGIFWSYVYTLLWSYTDGL